MENVPSHIDIGTISFYSSDLGYDITIHDYLKKLLSKLWEEGEGFSSKRPFGNGGWQLDLLMILIEKDIIIGVIDSDGYLESVSDEEEIKGMKIIADYIEKEL